MRKKEDAREGSIFKDLEVLFREEENLTMLIFILFFLFLFNRNRIFMYSKIGPSLCVFVK